MRYLITLIIVLLCSSCATEQSGKNPESTTVDAGSPSRVELTVDASTSETTLTSFYAMVLSIESKEDQEKFEEACMLLATDGIHFLKLDVKVWEEVKDDEEEKAIVLVTKLIARLDGLTVREIFDGAAKIKAGKEVDNLESELSKSSQDLE